MHRRPDLLSVIVRTKNRPALLQQALQSITQQTYRPIEIVLINDGGDPIDEIARVVVSDDLTLCLHDNPTSRGRTASANQGLNLASGRFSIFLDDDDYFDPEHLANLAAAYHDTAPQDGQLYAVYSGARAVHISADNQEHTLSQCGEPFSLQRLRYGNFMPILSVLFPTEVRERGIRFDEDFDLFEDWDFWLQVAQHCQFHYVDSCSCAYRIHDMASSVRNAQQAQAAYRQIYHKWLTPLDAQAAQELLACSHNWHEQMTARLQDANRQELDRIGALHENALGTITSKDQDIAHLSGLYSAAQDTIAQKDRDIKHLDALNCHALEVISGKDADIQHLSDLHAHAISVIEEKDANTASLAGLYEHAVAHVENLERQLANLTQAQQELQSENTLLKEELGRCSKAGACVKHLLHRLRHWCTRRVFRK